MLSLASSGQGGGGNGNQRPPNALLNPDDFGRKKVGKWRMKRKSLVN